MRTLAKITISLLLFSALAFGQGAAMFHAQNVSSSPSFSFSVVQSVPCLGSGINSCTFTTQNVATGNHILAFINGDNATSTISDNKSDVYTQYTPTSNGSSGIWQVFACAPVSATANGTKPSVSNSNGISYGRILLMEVSGLTSCAADSDGTKSASVGGATITSNSMTSTGVIVGVCFGTGASITAGSGFTAVGAGSPDGFYIGEYKVVSATQTLTCGSNPSGSDWSISTVSLH